MNLKNAINQFYFDMTLNELRLMNSKPHDPNITYNSILYLDIISYKQNCTVSFLADALNISKSAVTMKMNELIKQGLVVKTQSQQDKRINYLSIPPNVLDQYEEYDRAFHNSLKKIETKYSKKDIDIFCEILHNIDPYNDIGELKNE